MLDNDKVRFAELMHAVAEVYDKPLSETKLSIYWEDLREFNYIDIRNALRTHRKDPKAGQYMPKPADVIKVLQGDKKNNDKARVVTRCIYCAETKYVRNLGDANNQIWVCDLHFYNHRDNNLNFKNQNPLYVQLGK